MEVTTAAFLTKSSPAQFRHVFALYDEALKLKAESKSKRPAELIKMDEWYQNELPLKIAARAPDAFIIHDELINIMKWKLARGKFRPRLKELVTMNSPRVVQVESKKAIRALFKRDDLTSAVNYLCNLKGIGPATASAILTAAAPAKAAFMADEVLSAVPEIEGIDCTVAEYSEMMRHIRQAQSRLGDPTFWTLHRIELTLWAHNVLLTYRPELLQMEEPAVVEPVHPADDAFYEEIAGVEVGAGAALEEPEEFYANPEAVTGFDQPFNGQGHFGEQGQDGHFGEPGHALEPNPGPVERFQEDPDSRDVELELAPTAGSLSHFENLPMAGFGETALPLDLANGQAHEEAELEEIGEEKARNGPEEPKPGPAFCDGPALVLDTDPALDEDIIQLGSSNGAEDTVALDLALSPPNKKMKIL